MYWKAFLLLAFCCLVVSACSESENSSTSPAVSPQSATSGSKSINPAAEQRRGQHQTSAAQSAERQETLKRKRPVVQDRRSEDTVVKLFHSPLPKLSDERAGQISIEEISGFKTRAEYLTIGSRRFPDNIVAVTLPLDYDRDSHVSYPLVIAFGGYGECARPPRQGALAWLNYYKTDEAVLALVNNKLTTADFRGLVTRDRLNDFNRRLKRNPYGGVILACPASPPLSPRMGLESADYEAYIMKELIPALRNHYRVAQGKIGVDGVSMGGARSMYYGFKYPEVFCSIGSVQGAFGPYFDAYRELIGKNRDLLRKRAIQLVTSDHDAMLRSVEKMHDLLLAEHIPHVYLKLTGPHDYIFNQGPGALALLTFHDYALRMASRGPFK
jgi:pimeloyl-ACP methyl ester carboxylesterase